MNVRTVARLAAAAAVGIGLLALLGWALDVATLKSVVPGLAQMKANTALCGVLAGLALWHVAGPVGPGAPAARRATAISRAAGVGVALIGGLTLAEYVFGWNPGLDQLLFRDDLDAPLTSHPGRMAPNTALGFLLLGVALLLPDREPRPGFRPAQWLALTVGALSLAALVGYLYSVTTLYRLASFTGMSVNTAVVLFAVSGGLLVARRRAGAMHTVTSRGPAGRLIRILLPAVILVLVVIGWLRLLGERAGYFGPEAGVVITVSAVILTLTAVVLYAAGQTERIEEGQSRAEDLFQSAVAASPAGMLMVGPDGRIVLVNRQAEAIFGYRTDELIGQPVETLLPEARREAHRGERRAFVARPETRRMGAGRDLKGLRKNGSEVPVEIGLNPVDRGGETYVLASIVDITERLATEAALRERNEQFRQVTEAISEVYYLMDARFSETVYVSPAYEEVWGRRTEELYEAPRSFLDAVLDEDRPGLVEVIARVQRGEGPQRHEFRIERPDGEVRWILSHTGGIRDQAGEVYRLAGVALDITDRKATEEALRSSEQRLRTLFETVNLIVLGLDTDGRVAYVNPFLLELTGHERDEVVGQDWFAHFVPGGERPERKKVFRSVIETEGPAHHEDPIVTREGEERMISWHNTVLRNAEGRAIGTLSVGEDVTDRAILEQQYRHAQKMEAIGRLAGGVAHDFNNLLTAILGPVELMLLDLDTSHPMHADLWDIKSAAERAAGLTRQLLAFSRRQVLEPRVLDLNALIANLGRLLRRVIGEDIELTTRQAEDLGSVRADPGQLEQVILNLAVNSRDAMPKGGMLTIETANVELDAAYAESHADVVPGPYVMLAISDTGSGMDSVTRARVFEPFFTTKPKGKGTGLGLATVYGIIQQSDGHVWVYSEEGQGTTFKVYLPRLDAPADVTAAPAAPESLTGSETVLVVEDDEAVRNVTRKMLEIRGYRVLLAGRGEEALDIVRRHDGPIPLLVTDVVMPEMSGRELADRVRELRPETRVLHVSGYTDDAIVQHGVLEPDAHFLQKPFTPDGMARKVRQVLDADPA